MMEIDVIEIGSKWEDSLGKAVYSKKGNLMKERARRFVTITDKTSNSIEYKDDGGYMSWVALEEFVRIEKSVNKMRFVKLDFDAWLDKEFEGARDRLKQHIENLYNIIKK